MKSTTVEFRAYLAGASAVSFAQGGHGFSPDMQITAVEAMIDRGGDDFGRIEQSFKDWLIADEKQQNELLEAQPGAAKLSRPVADWTPAELIAALTSLSAYRYQLARDQRRLDEFLRCPGIQSNPAYKYAAENAGVIASEQNITVDPVWIGKLWKRLQSESVKLLEEGALGI